MESASVMNRYRSPAESWPRFQTGSLTTPSEAAGSRSYRFFVFDQPLPSTLNLERLYQLGDTGAVGGVCCANEEVISRAAAIEDLSMPYTVYGRPGGFRRFLVCRGCTLTEDRSGAVECVQESGRIAFILPLQLDCY